MQLGFARLLKQTLDRFVACPALSIDAAAGVNLMGRSGTASDRGANLRFIQPIADADDHPSPLMGTRTGENEPYLRMTVNIVRVSECDIRQPLSICSCLEQSCSTA
jgi:hypothetical protein